MISFLLVGVKKKPVSCCVEFLTSFNDVWHALWLVKLHHASITCSLGHPIVSFFVDTQRDPVWRNFPLSARQTTPCVTSTVASRCRWYTTNEIQKPSYANGLRWALKLWKIQKSATQPKHWSLILCSTIESPYFLPVFATFLSLAWLYSSTIS